LRNRGGISGTFQLDELETFEHNRRLAPVTMPFLIGRRSYFILDLKTASLPCRGGLSASDRQKKEERERLQGKRKSGSRQAVAECFQTLSQLHVPSGSVAIETDRKASYGATLRRLFGERLLHSRIHSRVRRTYENPLFPINHTMAMARDGISRLVRRNWGASKKRERLEWHGWIWAAWRNYVRGITNEAPRVTPAMVAGAATRRWSVSQMCAWRVLEA
jgi:hypothetical protein